MASKVPNQVYVTFKKQPVYDNGVIVSYGPPLGFLHAWNPKKPDDKKHQTQREWAYNSWIHNFKCEELNGHLWISGVRHSWVDGKSVQDNVYEPADPQPMVYDNEPLAGFMIQRYVSRYSTSNKLWRILDPRGFELEITTGSLDDLIRDTTILKGGLIEAKCVWASGKNLLVAS